MSLRARLLGALLGLILASGATVLAVAAPGAGASLVEVAGGGLRGRSDAGVVRYLGIPYAALTAGEFARDHVF